MRLDQWSDFSPEIDRDEIDVAGAEAFIAAYPSFYKSEWNAGLLCTWCHSQNLPTTLTNLTAAHAVLSRDGLLEIASKAGIRPSRKDVMVEALAKDTAEELKALEKLRDDPLLSDTTRRKRDAALKKLAIASRIAHRRGPPLRGGERIVI